MSLPSTEPPKSNPPQNTVMKCGRSLVPDEVSTANHTQATTRKARRRLSHIWGEVFFAHVPGSKLPLLAEKNIGAADVSKHRLGTRVGRVDEQKGGEFELHDDKGISFYLKG